MITWLQYFQDINGILAKAAASILQITNIDIEAMLERATVRLVVYIPVPWEAGMSTHL